ncbi:MAG: T9SS type A sorting domain-containing protein, partial [Saprospiraceae bacterium]
DVALSFNGEVQEAAFALYQNTPNPFKAETTIGFTLPAAGEATMKVYDATGKLLKQVTGDYAKGYNEVKLKRADLSATGLMYYTLESANNTATKRMVLVE